MQLNIQTCDIGESPYSYYIAVPNTGNMYFNTMREAKDFIKFYEEYTKKYPKFLKIDTDTI